jgi:hypothetical protein
MFRFFMGMECFTEPELKGCFNTGKLYQLPVSLIEAPNDYI